MSNELEALALRIARADHTALMHSNPNGSGEMVSIALTVEEEEAVVAALRALAQKETGNG